MARRVAFKQADVSRALKGAVNAGLKPCRAEIGADGRIVLVFEGAATEPVTEFDQWKAKRHARSA
jgi:hypothetical protein